MAEVCACDDLVSLEGMRRVVMCAHKHACAGVMRFVRAKHGNRLLVYIREQLDEALTLRGGPYCETDDFLEIE